MKTIDYHCLNMLNTFPVDVFNLNKYNIQQLQLKKIDASITIMESYGRNVIRECRRTIG